MRIFARTQSRTRAARSLTGMLAAGATLPEIMNEAVRALLAESGADRAAVWMESKEFSQAEDASLPVFQGFVEERDGETVPAEWKRLSMEAPLVTELLSRGETADLQLSGTPDGMSMGALLEMRRAVCAPILTEGSLRGVVFAAARHKQAKLEKSVVERLATELAIIAQMEDERKRARERQEDVVSASRILGSLASAGPIDAVLADVVDDCVKRSGSAFGPGAVFAVIGEIHRPGGGENGELATKLAGRGARCAAEIDMEFLWRSGDPAWTGAMERDPILGLWRRALESRRAEGGEPEAGGSSKVARLIAFPLEGGEEALGVLVAGLRQRDVSLATLERMELRAALATEALLVRQRSREIEQQRNWTRALLEIGSEPVVLVKPDGTIAKLNENAQSLLGAGEGFGDSSARVRHFADIFHARERTQVEAWLRAHTNGRSAKAVEVEALDCELATGAKVHLESIAAAKGEIAAVRLTPTEGSKGEAEERRAELELRNVIEWLEEGVVLFDERQQVRVMNTRFAQMAGLTPQESTRTQNLHRLIARMANQTAEPEKFAVRWLALAQGSESGVRDELQLLLPTPRVLERSARPVLDAQGGRLGRLEIYRDLTAQRVFHSKLIQTEKLAALGQMVTTIAHELSNPLTSILGYAQRLLAHSAEKGLSPDARQILHEAERASTILKQLLLTARNSRPERRKVQLNQIVTRTVELQNPALVAEKVRIELDLDPQLPLVLGEEGRLQQVLMNLIGNARQAIEQEGKAGTIRIRTRRAGGTHALLEVSDDGPGIPPEILAKIFDPFFTTKPAGIGTGLGLSIVLGIVREHGGQVRVTTPPGGGAAFSIELPAVPSDVRQRVPARAGQREGDEDLASLESETAGLPESVLAPWAGSQVLVVEDEATVAQLIADVLKDEGLDVEVLLDGREALRRAATEAYDLVICDMKMPDLDGEQFYRRLAKARSPLCRRVLFVTGDVLAAQTRQFLQRNALAHLAKPFRVEELTAKVREVLAETCPRELGGTKTNVARN